MPGMDGIELAKRAAERDGTLKIMFITGFAAVALHPASGRPNRPRSCPSPSICARSWRKSIACWRRRAVYCAAAGARLAEINCQVRPVTNATLGRAAMRSRHAFSLVSSLGIGMPRSPA